MLPWGVIAPAGWKQQFLVPFFLEGHGRLAHNAQGRGKISWQRDDKAGRRLCGYVECALGIRSGAMGGEHLG